MSKVVTSVTALSLALAALAIFLLPTHAALADDKATGGEMSKEDLKFMTDAATGGMMEVKLGQLAADKASAADVKAFGKQMVDDHSKANEELMLFARGKNVTLPTDLESKQQKAYDKLSAKSGDDFDKAYVKMMLKDHQEDVDEFQKFAERGDDTALKGWASKTLPILQDHLKTISDIDKKMGGKGDTETGPGHEQK